MRFAFLALLLVLSGCSHFVQEKIDDEKVRAARQAEENEIYNAEKVLSLGRFEEARILFRDFHGRRPQSVFFQSAKLGEAQALDGLGKYSEATSLYREIYLKTLTDQPKIAALAVYKMSYSYEAMGDDVKALASLLDAKKMGTFLPLEVSQAEIPARLAAIYARQGREKEALEYLNEAEKGITTVQKTKGPEVKKDWLAKAFFQMGNISTNQLSQDNFENIVNSQKLVQVYLIKALRVGDATWSTRAEQKLQETYRDLLTQLEAAKDKTRQADIGGSLLDVMDQAELYKPVAENKMNQYEENFYKHLSVVRKKAEGILYSGSESMTLTEESQKLNSLKRAERVMKPLLPETKKSSISFPPKVVPSEDPNL